MSIKKLYALIALCVSFNISIAQTYPDRPIKLITPSQAGGPADNVARIIADKLSERLGQPVVVDNKPGASGIVGVKSALASPADGYTLMMFFTDNFTLAPLMFKKAPYDVARDVEVIGSVAKSGPYVLVTNLPFASFQDFINHAKSAPGKVTFSSYGMGSTPHVSMVMLNEKLGIELVHVPFKSGMEMAQSVTSKTVTATSMSGFDSFIKGNGLKPLAVAGNKRHAAFPDAPPLSDFGGNDLMFASAIYGLAVPAGVPKAIVTKLQAVLKEIVPLPDLPQKMAGFGNEPIWMSGPDFTKEMLRQREAYRPIIEKLGLNNQ